MASCEGHCACARWSPGRHRRDAAPGSSACGPWASAISTRTPTDPPPLTLAFYDTETNDRAQLLGEARKAGLAGISLWRLGLEDPATWAVLGRRARNAGRSTALAVVSGDPIRRGSGEVASIPQSSQEGRRVLTWDPAGEQVVDERYLSLPRPEQVVETGPGRPRRRE